MASTAKSRAGNSSREDAPLLANNSPNDFESNGGEVTDKGASKPNTVAGWFYAAWQWIRSNIVIIAMGLLLLGGVIALCIYFGVMSKGTSTPDQNVASICLTPACVLAASAILANMSPRYAKIDPCTEFDKFVCEGWDEQHDLRADQGSSFTGTIMAENSQRILRRLLDSPYPVGRQTIETHSSSKQKIFSKLQDGYESCMNEEVIKSRGSSPLLGVLRKIEELFPARRPQGDLLSFPIMFSDNQKEISIGSESQLSRTVAYLATIGVSALLDFSIGADDKDPDVVLPFINAPRQPGLPSKEYYRDPQVVARYSDTVGQVLEALLREAQSDSAVFRFFGRNLSASNAELVEGIISLESDLARATPDTEDAEDVTKYYNPHSPDEITSLLPQLPMQSLFTSLAPSGYTPGKVIVGSPSYLKVLSSTLRKTSIEVLQAYIVWKTVQRYADKVEGDALKPLLRFSNELQGKEPDASEERWRTCMKFADRGLGWILSKFFVEKAFSSEAKHFGDHIVSDIKTQFIQKLDNADWMSKDVRELGVEKVHNIIQKIGYPSKSPDIRNSSALEKYYESVNISTDAFFENTLSIAEFDVRREWSALGKPTNRNEWGMTADTVNAYYNPAGNEIVFPAGIMQAPVFYDPAIPQYLTYGAFGSVSGHELSHAFDSTGRHYDETGNFTDWWDDETVHSFEDKAKCFVDQYHEFTVPKSNGDPLHVNGRLTLGENIADAGGLNAAFAAWKEVDTGNPGELLPGLQHFSKEQLFFISYGNWWCGKARPETAINLIYRDPHSPTWARILGTMANSRDFKEAFSCPTKDPTCELW